MKSITITSVCLGLIPAVSGCGGADTSDSDEISSPIPEVGVEPQNENCQGYNWDNMTCITCWVGSCYRWQCAGGPGQQVYEGGSCAS
jgi:hypothetical protein